MDPKIRDRINEVKTWDHDRRQDEYLSLIAHTSEDALDEGELRLLCALCWVFLGYS